MIERLARLGYVSIGTVYVVAGVLAAAAGMGLGGSTGGKESAFAFIRDQPFGHILLVIMAVGLLGYTIWRLVSAVADTDSRGSDAKGILVRIGSIARGLFYGVIALEVIRIATHRGSGDTSETQARHWTKRIIDEPFGRWVIAAAGLIFVAIGAYQFYRAWESKLGKRLHLGTIEPRVRRNVIALSRFGIAARAVVFFVIGGSLIVAAIRHNPQAAHGTSGALRQIAAPFGGALLILVGIGLAAYGIYAFVNARYRSIRA